MSQSKALKNLISWVHDNALILAEENESDPPHAHLNDFIQDWHELSNEDIKQVISVIGCSGGNRRTALVCEIAEAAVDLPIQPKAHSEVFMLSYELNSPPALYLPCRIYTSSNADIHRRRLEGLDVGVFEARMSCSSWVDSGKDVFDVTIDFIQGEGRSR